MSEGGWILVIDDDDDTREMIALLLGLEGYRVVPASDGVDGFARIRDMGSPPALVLLDMRMPRMNGVDFAQALRQDPRFAAVPIVVVSGDAAGRDAMQTLQTREWIIKPVELTRLVQIVADIVGPREAESPQP